MSEASMAWNIVVLLGWIALAVLGVIGVLIAVAIIAFLSMVAYALAVDDDWSDDYRGYRSQTELIDARHQAEQMGA